MSLNLLAAVLLAGVAGAAFGQGFPSRPITLYVPFVPGPTELMARKFAEVATRHLGQTVLVEPKPGAGATLAPVQMARTRPDGYTLSVVTSSLFRYPSMQKVEWDPIADFTYITGLTTDAVTIGVASASPFRTLEDAMQWARANPGKLSFGSPGAGTSMHVLGETVAAMMKASILHVPYKGGSDVMRALLGGEIMIAGDTGAAFAGYATSGRARPLVQFGETRVRWMADVPTARELGLDMVYTVPTVVAGPRGLPESIVQRLHEAFSKTFEDKDALRFFENMKKDPWPMTPAGATAWARESVALERKMVERAGMAIK